ncbi:MAG: DUF2799 domain-containing protein [Gammaproteobacteria bacterium]|nr:DUF2799 domain-containing protein [Gammaproteobacteria bacterium]
MNFMLLRWMADHESVSRICGVVIALVGFLALLSACSMVSTNGCDGTDLRIQGVAAAQTGLTEQQARDVFVTCRPNSSQTDQSAFIAGYHEGIETYCTRSQGFRTGMEGYLYQNVCPEDSEESFLTGYRVGSALFIADVELRAAKIAFASSSAPSEFIGSPPSAEHNRFLLETFPQTRDSARALVSQMRWQPTPSSDVARKRSYGSRDLTSVINRCKAAKKEAEELGFVVGEAC